MAAFNLFKRLLGDSDRRERNRVQARNGARMLVVDDSSTIRAVLAKMLIQDGYTVLKAGDGETALAVAQQEKPDLIFLDIVLPGMNGFAVLRALRRDERTREIPIVMISGNLQATEQFYVQRFGADDFMKKPFGRAEVFSRIQELVKSGRLPKREAVSAASAAVADMEDMTDIPDVALPDEDLDEHDSAVADKTEIGRTALESELAAGGFAGDSAGVQPEVDQAEALGNDRNNQDPQTVETPAAADLPEPAEPTEPDDLAEQVNLSENAEPAMASDLPEPPAPPQPPASVDTPETAQHELALQHVPTEVQPALEAEPDPDETKASAEDDQHKP